MRRLRSRAGRAPVLVTSYVLRFRRATSRMSPIPTASTRTPPTTRSAGPTQVVDDYGGTGHLNNTTDFAYGPAGMTSQTSEQPGGVNQTTAWIYGVTTAGGSAIDSNDVVSAIEYPDPTTGVAAAVMLLFRRWSSAFLALSLNSSLLFTHSWYQASLRGHWWGSFLFLWILIGAVSLLGMVRSLHRSRTIVMQEGSSRGEWIMLCLLSFITMSGVMYCVTCHKSLLDPGQRAALVMFIGTWISLSYVLFRRYALRRGFGS